MEIRDFQPQDVEALVAILKANQQYGHPDIDGPEAMLRVQTARLPSSWWPRRKAWSWA